MPQRSAPKTATRRKPPPLRRLELEAGWLGRFFGVATNAPMNIAGASTLLLIVVGAVLALFGSPAVAHDYWATTETLIKVAFGVMLGRRGKD